MNEQQLADLFSTQLDFVLAGGTVEAPVGELSGLLNLGQQLSQVKFQASAPAQAAFQAQLVSWFGPAGGAGLALTKGLLLALVAAVGTGIGLTALVMSLLGGNLLSNADPQLPETLLPATATPVETPLPPTTPVETPLPPATEKPPITAVPSTPAIQPATTSRVGDTLPAFSTLTDTILIDLTVTSTPPIMASPEPDPLPSPTTTPAFTPTVTNDDNGNSGDESARPDDHDRGHGNDPDGVDEDNPGNSSGVDGGSGQDKKDEAKGGNRK